jgi:hypothetical protein
MKKQSHGGARKGAGRKPGKKAFKNVAKKPRTVVMRVPEQLVEYFKQIIKQWYDRDIA